MGGMKKKPKPGFSLSSLSLLVLLFFQTRVKKWKEKVKSCVHLQLHDVMIIFSHNHLSLSLSSDKKEASWTI